MKEILTKKNIALLAVVFVIGLGGSILYKSSKENKNSTTTTSITTTTNKNTDSSTKTDEGNPTTTVTTKTTTQTIPTVPADTTGLGALTASLTATKSSANDISLAFYMEAGQFTVQERVNGVWKATTENIFYPGSGGLVASELKAGEDTKVIRLYRIENGKYTKVSKEFTVVRADVVSAGGIKTYN